MVTSCEFQESQKCQLIEECIESRLGPPPLTSKTGSSDTVATENAQLETPTRLELLVDPDSLPSPPVIALEILRLLADEESLQMADIARLVGQDVRLTTAVIRTANSAAYGATSKVTSIDLALAMIGARALRLLVISTSMTTLMPKSSAGESFHAEARKRTLVCATLSRVFAEEINPAIADEAFLVGLLGSLGHLVLNTVAPEVHAGLMDLGETWPIATDEYALLGYSTDEVTADLLVSWGMPEVLAEAVALRDPLHAKVTPRLASRDLVVALRLGLMSERVLCGVDSGQSLFALLEQARGVLGLELVTLSDILVDAEAMVAEVASSVHFETPEESHADLVRVATETMQNLA